MKCGREDPYLFLMILRRNEATMEFDVLHEVFGKETVEREDEQSQKVRGKTEKDFKNCPSCAKHAFFAAEVSRQIVAKSTSQNTSSQKF